MPFCVRVQCRLRWLLVAAVVADHKKIDRGRTVAVAPKAGKKAKGTENLLAVGQLLEAGGTLK